MTPPDTADPDAHLALIRMRSAVLVGAAELAGAIGRADRPVVLAVRGPDGGAPGAWSSAPRIPGAVDTFLASDFAAPSHPRRGSRPLPDVDSLQASARRWGLRATSPVVVYDHEGGLQAARAWWVLRWAGLRSVRLLDGGFAAWQAAGAPVVVGPPDLPVAGDLRLAAGAMPELDADAAARLARDGVLIDSRIRPNYEGGATAPGEPPRGHIPGAVSLPAPANLDADGRFLEPARLQALYVAAGVRAGRPVGVYCGAGVSAAHDVLALASLGIEAPMYVGSWSAWSADASRPVAQGAAPG